MIDRLTSNESPIRALGIDPGAHLGWCVLERDGAGVRYVASGVLELEASDVGLTALRLAARGLLDAHRPTIVALERERAIYLRGRFGPSMATGLVAAAWAGGEFAAIASQAAAVRTFTHTEAKIAIGAPAGDGRAVTAALRVRVAGWPRVSEHQRDAGAVALAVLCDGSRHA